MIGMLITHPLRPFPVGRGILFAGASPVAYFTLSDHPDLVSNPDGPKQPGMKAHCKGFAYLAFVAAGVGKFILPMASLAAFSAAASASAGDCLPV
jgi:hypothetical protein